MDLEHAVARAGLRRRSILLAAAAGSCAAVLASAAAAAETLDAIAVQNGSLVGQVNGRTLNARDLAGTSFSDGALVYSIVDVASDPFLPGVWRYRITWKAQDARDWNAMCRNSRGTTGWAYALPSSDDGPRFVCEDTDLALCFAGANGLTAQKAISRCLGD
jgi:hypothetical protein